MEPHDLAAQAQPNAGAVRLGRKKGNEDLGERFFDDARPIVRDLDDDFVVRQVSGQVNASPGAAGCGFAGIAQ